MLAFVPLAMSIFQPNIKKSFTPQVTTGYIYANQITIQMLDDQQRNSCIK